MRVLCKSDSAAALPDSLLDPAIGIERGTVFALTLGREYVVYAVTTFRGHCWYYVFDDNTLPYPVWKLADLFEVRDHTIPGTWVIDYVHSPGGASPEGWPILSFPEWALDRTYYERLVDGDPQAHAVFEARRTDAEFPAQRG